MLALNGSEKMPHTVIRLCDHPSNLDKSAVWVSGMHEPGMIFRVIGGYLAITDSHDTHNTITGLFESKEKARAAIAKARNQ